MNIHLYTVISLISYDIPINKRLESVVEYEKL